MKIKLKLGHDPLTQQVIKKCVPFFFYLFFYFFKGEMTIYSPFHPSLDASNIQICDLHSIGFTNNQQAGHNSLAYFFLVLNLDNFMK